MNVRNGLYYNDRSLTTLLCISGRRTHLCSLRLYLDWTNSSSSSEPVTLKVQHETLFVYIRLYLFEVSKLTDIYSLSFVKVAFVQDDIAKHRIEFIRPGSLKLRDTTSLYLSTLSRSGTSSDDGKTDLQKLC
jgi:hypothetical protein